MAAGGEASGDTATGGAGAAGGKRGLVSWCLYDWANQGFNTVIGTFIFSTYFTQAVAVDETTGTSLWANALTVAGLVVAVTSPILGAIADRAGKRKPWVAGFAVLCIAASAALALTRPETGWVAFALVGFGVGAFAFEMGNVFYNAMMANLVPPQRMGRLSGWGWGTGYLGGLACLGTCLVLLVGDNALLAPLLPQDAQLPVRLTSLVVALWFAVFSLPFFFLTPDPAPARPLPPRQAVRAGLAQLAGTLKRIRHYAIAVRFLIARMLYNEGLATLFAFGGVYAAGTFGMAYDEILIFAIALNVAAGLGAFGFGWIDDWIGPRTTILIALAVLIAAGTAILLIDRVGLFWALAMLLGLFVGPAQASSRALMARLAPQGMESEMFGLFALSGKAITWLGPLALGLMTDAFDSQRAGMSVIVVLFAAGLLLLLTVPPVPPRSRGG